MRPLRIYAIHRTCAGFTLVEVMSSLGVIGVLLAFLSPSLHSARESARSAVCRSNLRQHGIGLELYQHSYPGWIPFADGIFDIRLGWLQPLDQLAPFMDIEVPSFGADGRVYASPVLKCPSDGKHATVSGWSYSYLAAGYIEHLNHRLASLHYQRRPETALIIDAGRNHTGTSGAVRHELRIDGSVSARSLVW